MIHFKEQEKFVKIPSPREFQPSKLFVKFVNFYKFCCASDNTSSFKLDFFFNFITLLLRTVVP